jgi:hypothetical protein
VAAIEQSGLTPLDFLLQLMRDAEQPLGLRADAAKNAAPYVHPRLAAVEHSGKVMLPIVISSADADL